MLIAVSICVFIFVGGLERFIVLGGVEAMAERQRLDNDLRQRPRDTEAYANYLRRELTNLSNGERTGQGS